MSTNYRSTFSPRTSLPPASPPQIIKNREKQAIRDAWAQRDALPLNTVYSPGPISVAPGSQYAEVEEEREEEELGYRGYLPNGMNVRDALARCEGPTLGWSLQFWVTIADPIVSLIYTFDGLCTRS